MEFIDEQFSTPEEHLACDEVLLDLCESGGEESLRFWEFPRHFIVLGSSNRVQEEVFVERCRTDGVPILRRHSGGGTVLQGPGCLNCSLVLRIDSNGPTGSITDTTNFIMQRHARILTNLLREEIEMKGSSDLVIASKKISGNAQRRKLRALLFHGTLLLDFDLSLIERYLKMPSKQPAYREERNHSQFVRNIPVSAEAVRQALRVEWNASESRGVPKESIAALVHAKYSRDDWNFRM